VIDEKEQHGLFAIERDLESIRDRCAAALVRIHALGLGWAEREDALKRISHILYETGAISGIVSSYGDSKWEKPPELPDVNR
jgi:hypothetical protein